jgi:RNA polymerase sigma factor (TIGR02999 family)
MHDVTRILAEIHEGNPAAASQLLPVVYSELRRLASAKMAEERVDLTVQATALVHEAYIRLVDVATPQHWQSRAHFFAAAAEAMRRVLIERARRRMAEKRGAGRERIPLEQVDIQYPEPEEKLLALDEALERLATTAPQKAQLIQLRYFAGMTIEEAAVALGISSATANRYWAYARAWLQAELEDRSNDIAGDTKRPGNSHF